MLMDRIMKVFTFKTEVFAEVENDASFTPTAWGIVAVIQVISQIGAFLAAPAAAAAAAEMAESFGVTSPAMAVSPVSIVTGTLTGVLAFAVGAWVVAFVGKSLFKASVTFEEVVRVMGLAAVWGILGLVTIIAFYVPLLACVIAPIGLVVWVLSIVSSAIAIKEALDLEWVPTIVTVVIAWITIFIATMILGMIFGIFNGLLG